MARGTILVGTEYEYDAISGHRINVLRNTDNVDRGSPWVMHFHGGGFTSGDHCNVPPNWQREIDRGIVVIGVEYGKSPAVQYPEMLSFAGLVRSYVAANFRKLKVDPNRFAVAGESVGGYLALMAMRDLIDVACCVAYYPVTNFATLASDFDPFITPRTDWEAAESGATHYLGFQIDTVDQGEIATMTAASAVGAISASSKPTFLAWSRADSLVPSHQSVRVLSALQELEIEVEAREVIGDIHGWWLGEAVDEARCDFLSRHLQLS